MDYLEIIFSNGYSWFRLAKEFYGDERLVVSLQDYNKKNNPFWDTLNSRGPSGYLVLLPFVLDGVELRDNRKEWR